MTPHLTAQHAGYLQKQMLDFRDGARANDPAGMMRAAMTQLTDPQIFELATYLAATARESYETR
jgi:cytochrome c553